MIQPPPRSTLLPDTTLFRSAGHDPAALHPAEHQRADALRVAGGVEGVLVHERDREGAAQLRQHLHGARKSTRLNSSHANISYAVFCLTKQNNLILDLSPMHV